MFVSVGQYKWSYDLLEHALITNQIHFGTNKNRLLLYQSYNQHLRFFGDAINSVCSLCSWYMLKIVFCYLMHTDRRSCWATDAFSDEMRSLCLIFISCEFIEAVHYHTPIKYIDTVYFMYTARHILDRLCLFVTNFLSLLIDYKIEKFEALSVLHAFVVWQKHTNEVSIPTEKISIFNAITSRFRIK